MKGISGALEFLGDVLEAVVDWPLWIWLPALIALCLYLWVSTKPTPRPANGGPDGV